jgi:hypothetical protein
MHEFYFRFQTYWGCQIQAGIGQAADGVGACGFVTPDCQEPLKNKIIYVYCFFQTTIINSLSSKICICIIG